MKKIKYFLILTFIFCAVSKNAVFAEIGDSGFFGGITEGKRLPKTTETLLLNAANSKKNAANSLLYKEVIFMSGKPVEFEGTLSRKSSGAVTDKADIGTYTITYDIKPSTTIKQDVAINRTIVFNVNYRKVENQIIKDYEVKSWNETIKTEDNNYKIDPKQSFFGVSFIEDHTAGVVYYKGNISKRAVYIDDAELAIEVESSGDIYGYNTAWSSTETHRIDSSLYSDEWQMQYQERPSVSVNKILQYGENEPNAISFSGNYREVMQNKSGLEYDIFSKPKQLLNIEDAGKANIKAFNTFEQLIAKDTNFLKGNFAEYDIKKLFSMQILTGDPKFYKPNEAITRGQFVTALVRAIKIPIEIPVETKAKNKTVTKFVFPDVLPEREDYPYIMAAYKKGIAVGRDNGNFYVNANMQRQEAIVMIIRSLGLENLGLDSTPITAFVDNNKISDWAKREMYIANQIGIISADDNGNIRPEDFVSKAEAASFINRLIEYMRSDMQVDYTEHIVNYAN